MSTAQLCVLATQAQSRRSSSGPVGIASEAGSGRGRTDAHVVDADLRTGAEVEAWNRCCMRPSYVSSRAAAMSFEGIEDSAGLGSCVTVITAGTRLDCNTEGREVARGQLSPQPAHAGVPLALMLSCHPLSQGAPTAHSENVRPSMTHSRLCRGWRWPLEQTDADSLKAEVGWENSRPRSALLHVVRPAKPQATQRPAPLGPERPADSLCSTKHRSMPSPSTHGRLRKPPQAACHHELSRTHCCSRLLPSPCSHYTLDTAEEVQRTDTCAIVADLQGGARVVATIRAWSWWRRRWRWR